MPAERLLLLETSGRVGQVGLAEGERMISVGQLDPARRHARDLTTEIQRQLATQGWGIRDVTAVAVSRGPGSFTGLRVGIAAANALAYATGCRVVGVETFAAIAAQAHEPLNALEIIADAHQGKLFRQSFVRSHDECAWAPVSPISVVLLEDWLASRNADVLLSGPGIRVLRDRLGVDVRLSDESSWEPNLKGVLAIARRALERRPDEEPRSIEPLYVRASAAEENRTGASLTR